MHNDIPLQEVDKRVTSELVNNMSVKEQQEIIETLNARRTSMEARFRSSDEFLWRSDRRSVGGFGGDRGGAGVA